MFTLTQNRWKIDDVLGVWPLHGLCGALGGIAAGVLGMKELGGLGKVASGAASEFATLQPNEQENLREKLERLGAALKACDYATCSTAPLARAAVASAAPTEIVLGTNGGEEYKVMYESAYRAFEQKYNAKIVPVFADGLTLMNRTRGSADFHADPIAAVLGDPYKRKLAAQILGYTGEISPEELKRLRAEVAAARQAASVEPDTHDYSEAETRDYFIDLLLKEAGWALDQQRDREFRPGRKRPRGIVQ